MSLATTKWLRTKGPNTTGRGGRLPRCILATPVITAICLLIFEVWKVGEKFSGLEKVWQMPVQISDDPHLLSTWC